MYCNGRHISREGSLMDQVLLAVQETPHVIITEQPDPQGVRFRYSSENEGRSAGSIPGIHSTPEQRTYPSIEVRGYNGAACAVVSCVTKDEPYFPHPHSLVGRGGCTSGVCTVEIDPTTMRHTFNNLGVQCVRKKDIKEALRLREEIRVDPFRTGFDHANDPARIDLNAIRLCFQVFLKKDGKYKDPLQPVVSDVIYDRRTIFNLTICALSHVSAPVDGGREIILLCEKVTKQDIKVLFYEQQCGVIVWEDYGKITNVHKQVAISFKTPPYRTMEIELPVMVNIQLIRPSDEAKSEPRPFELTPLLDKQKKRKHASCWRPLEQMLPALHSATHPTNLQLSSIPTTGGGSSVIPISDGYQQNVISPGIRHFHPKQNTLRTPTPMVVSPVYHEQPLQQVPLPVNTINQQNINDLLQELPGPSGLQPVQPIQPIHSTNGNLDDILRMTGLTQLNISVSEELQIDQLVEGLLETKKSNYKQK